MKYKNIKSASHNFTHSFVSGMNYVDDEHVLIDLAKCVEKNKDYKISVQWLPETKTSWFSYTPRIRKSIKYYKKWLPNYLSSHGISSSIIKELRTDITLFKGHRLVIESYAKDSRGREYVQRIK
jgi:hypothetical protein